MNGLSLRLHVSLSPADASQAAHGGQTMTETIYCFCAEFDGLKSELERLLIRNRGLTRFGSPAAAAPSTTSSREGSSQQGSNSAASNARSLSGSSSCSSNRSCTSTAQPDRSSAQHEEPVSEAVRASQQLDHDVTLLLQQVDSVMTAPVLQLPAWFTSRSASPACTVAELPESTVPPGLAPHADALQHRIVTPELTAHESASPDSAPADELQHRIVTPKRKACSVSPPAQQTTDSSQQQSFALQKSSHSRSHTQGAATAPEVASAHELSAQAITAFVDTATPRAHSEPDNLDILHEACKVSPSQSQDTPTSIANDQQHHYNGSFDSPHHWHTNHLADSHEHDTGPFDSCCLDHSRSGPVSGSRPSDSCYTDHMKSASVSRSQPSDSRCSNHGKSASVSSSVSSSSHAEAHHSMLASSKQHNIKQQAQESHGDSALIRRASSDDEQSENVAPAWHEQRQRYSNSSSKSAAMSTAGKDHVIGMKSQSKAVEFDSGSLIGAGKAHNKRSQSTSAEFGSDGLISAGRSNLSDQNAAMNSQGKATECGGGGWTGAGRSSLLEGYIEGLNAKLQLPAAVRTRSRNSALHARTPLRSITEVSSEP